MMAGTQSEPIYIVDGARTPFLKSRNTPGPFSISDINPLARPNCSLGTIKLMLAE